MSLGPVDTNIRIVERADDSILKQQRILGEEVMQQQQYAAQAKLNELPGPSKTENPIFQISNVSKDGTVEARLQNQSAGSLISENVSWRIVDRVGGAHRGIVLGNVKVQNEHFSLGKLESDELGDFRRLTIKTSVDKITVGIGGKSQEIDLTKVTSTVLAQSQKPSRVHFVTFTSGGETTEQDPNQQTDDTTAYGISAREFKQAVEKKDLQALKELGFKISPSKPQAEGGWYALKSPGSESTLLVNENTWLILEEVKNPSTSLFPIDTYELTPSLQRKGEVGGAKIIPPPVPKVESKSMGDILYKDYSNIVRGLDLAALKKAESRADFEALGFKDASTERGPNWVVFKNKNIEEIFINVNSKQKEVMIRQVDGTKEYHTVDARLQTTNFLYSQRVDGTFVTGGYVRDGNEIRKMNLSQPLIDDLKQRLKVVDKTPFSPESLKALEALKTDQERVALSRMIAPPDVKQHDVYNAQRLMMELLQYDPKARQAYLGREISSTLEVLRIPVFKELESAAKAETPAQLLMATNKLNQYFFTDSRRQELLQILEQCEKRGDKRALLEAAWNKDNEWFLNTGKEKDDLVHFLKRGTNLIGRDGLPTR
jgi:hypothetical protein